MKTIGIYAKGYRCKETGKYKPLKHWAQELALRFGVKEHSVSVAIIKAALRGTTYHGMTFERVERGGPTR